MGGKKMAKVKPAPQKKQVVPFPLSRFREELESNNVSEIPHIVECPFDKLSEEFRNKPKSFLKSKLFDLSTKYDKIFRLSGAFGKLSDKVSLGKNGIRIAKKHFDDTSYTKGDKFKLKIEDDRIILTRV
jgi:hypothetical protein